MKIKLRGNRVAVEKNKNAPKGQTGFIIVPENEEYSGTVRYVGPDVVGIKEGQKVYFTTNYQASRIAGVDLCVMEDKEVYAVIAEE